MDKTTKKERTLFQVRFTVVTKLRFYGILNVNLK